MNFFGMVWVLAYFGNLFSSPAPPKAVDYLSKVIPARALSLISSSISDSVSDSIARTTFTPSRTDPSVPVGAIPTALPPKPPAAPPLSPLGWLQPQRGLLPALPLVTVSEAAIPTRAPAAADTPDTASSCQDESIWRSTTNSGYQVQVRGKTIAEVPTQADADSIAWRLRQVLQHPEFDPETLQPALTETIPVGKAKDTILFWVDHAIAMTLDRNPELLAIAWTNNLRSALDVAPLPLVTAQSQMHQLTATDSRITGDASWYGPDFQGKPTATGETFNQTDLTAAHPSLPFGTFLKVANLDTGNTIVVRVNDRGPYFAERTLDLSREAARCLNSEISGVVPYEAVVLLPEGATPPPPETLVPPPIVEPIEVAPVESAPIEPVAEVGQGEGDEVME